MKIASYNFLFKFQMFYEIKKVAAIVTVDFANFKRLKVSKENDEKCVEKFLHC